MGPGRAGEASNGHGCRTQVAAGSISRACTAPCSTNRNCLSREGLVEAAQTGARPHGPSTAEAEQRVGHRFKQSSRASTDHLGLAPSGVTSWTQQMNTVRTPGAGAASQANQGRCQPRRETERLTPHAAKGPDPRTGREL